MDVYVKKHAKIVIISIKITCTEIENRIRVVVLMSIGKRIINLREKHNLSQRELATRLDINVSVMNRIESGERAIRDTELIKIAQIFNVKTDYLLGLTDSPTPIDDDEAEF